MNAALIITGIFVLLGTAGSADLNAISLTQMVVQGLIGLALLFAGVTYNGKKKEEIM